jgi:pheromone shutdown-related protein TraB
MDTTSSDKFEHKDLHQIQIGEKTIFLVGTAHVSQASVDLVESAINQISPDSVAVELCQSRFESIRDPDRWKKTDIVSVIRQGKAYLLMAQLFLSAFQKKIGNKLEVKPGAEMIKAIDIAESKKIDVVLADRDIRTTLKRAWHSMGIWSATKLFVSLFSGIISPEEVDEKEIERLKSGDVLAGMMAELGKTLPGIRTSLIDERDQYLAAKIISAPGKKVLAVVGAGHVPGIKQYLNSTINLSALEQEPPRGMTSKVLSWGVPVVLIGLLVYGFYAGGAQTSTSMVITWSLTTGGLAALGSLIAWAHPLTILTSAVAAPIATLHPFIAAGWVAGIVEALLRKPEVRDIENIGDDLMTLKGVWKNRLCRVLIIIAFTNIGSMIGIFLAVPMVASMATK